MRPKAVFENEYRRSPKIRGTPITLVDTPLGKNRPYSEPRIIRTRRRFPKFIFRLFSLIGGKLPRFAYPVITGPLRGAKIVVGSLAGRGGGASVYFNLVEVEQTKFICDVVQPGDVFFDIGANCGYYSLLASKLVGPKGFVCAVEPVIRNISFLHRHIKINRVQNVLVIPAACGNSIDLVRFEYGKNWAEGHICSEKTSSPIGIGDSESIVPVVTIDRLCQILKVTPSVMKIDVEGFELDVLHGAERTLGEAKPYLFLSVHSNELGASCKDYLTGLGYEVNPLDPYSPTPDEFFAKSTQHSN